MNYKKPLFVSSNIYKKPAFGNNHPLGHSRVGAVMDIGQQMGWLDDSNYHQNEPASIETLSRLHHPDYIQAVKKATETQSVSAEMRQSYKIGTMENPVFPGLFQRAASTVQGSILAAELASEGRVVFHPSGGTHHGRPDHASGFCYFNDPAFAILTLLERLPGPVLYVDIDAHHGDGVQDFFAEHKRVWTVSLHEEGKWPGTGTLDDVGGGRSFNLPVPPGVNDADLMAITRMNILPLIEAIQPSAIVLCCGADGLLADPLSNMAFSNNGVWQCVKEITDAVPASVVVGGGGYNPWTTIRLWVGLWAVLAGFEIPEILPQQCQDVLAPLDCDLVDEEDVEDYWLTSLFDPKERQSECPVVLERIAVLQKRISSIV